MVWKKDYTQNLNDSRYMKLNKKQNREKIEPCRFKNFDYSPLFVSSMFSWSLRQQIISQNGMAISMLSDS